MKRRNSRYIIMSSDGLREIGEVGRQKSNPSTWGLFMPGVYWSTINGKPNTVGGYAGTKCKTRREAIDLARSTDAMLAARAGTTPES